MASWMDQVGNAGRVSGGSGGGAAAASAPIMSNNNSLQAIILGIGETFIPGLGFANSLASTYLQIDLTYYVMIGFGALAVFTGMSYVTEKAWGWVSPYVVSTAEIRCDDEVYNYLMYWATKQNFSSRTTNFVASVRTSSSHVWTGEEDEDKMEHENDESDDASDENTNWDKMKTVNFTPAEGRHIFWYRGRPFTFGRYRNENQGLWSSSLSETIYLTTIARNTRPLKNLLQEAQLLYHERDGGKTVIYRGMKPPGAGSDELEWMRCLSRPPRPMSTVVLDDSQKNEIVGDMKEYLRIYTRKWYSNRGLPYRRGYLFHGPPGTGKTSLCFALAGLLNLRIYVVSLNSKSVTEDSLAKLFSDLPWRCIILLEDIDSADITTKRSEIKEEEEEETKTEKKDGVKPTTDSGGANSTNPRGITLSAFLNIIDGVASSEGRILVMTTNHIEKLDPAILRPGRVDVTIRFRFADREMIKGIFKAIYGNFKEQSSKVDRSDHNVGRDFVHVNGNGKASPAGEGKKIANGGPVLPVFATASKSRHHNKTEDEVEAMAEEFAEKMTPDEYTPAEIQGFLLRHKYTPQEAVDGIETFIISLREEKEVQKKGIAA